MPLALLLSPDDQAVSAITSVLEEMSVTCERPLDGASAAQKLNSNRFDLVLVDCENLPAAKLIFDVCRNRKGGGRPVPVAVVDGRAGLPTAFRLGAELILTKPVAKDQARITIRTAISRVKKEDSLQGEGTSADTAQSATPATAQESVVTQTAHSTADEAADAAPQERAFAASAAAGPALTSYSDPVLSPSAATASAATVPAPIASAPTGPTSMNATVEEPEIVEEESPSTVEEPAASAAPRTLAQASARAAARTSAKDPVLSEPEEFKATPDAQTTPAAISLVADDFKAAVKPSPAFISSTPDRGDKLTASEPKSANKPGQKSYGLLITVLVLVVAGGGFYAAWTYEPAFQALAKSQINQLLVRLGMAPQPQQHPAPAPVRPGAQGPKPSPGVPLPTITPGAASSSQPTGTDPNAVSGTASSPVVTAPSGIPASASPTSGQQPAAKTGASSAPSSVAPSAAGTPAQPAVVLPKSGVTRIDLSPNVVEHPASSSGSKSSSAPTAPKSPPPQH